MAWTCKFAVVFRDSNLEYKSPHTRIVIFFCYILFFFFVLNSRGLFCYLTTQKWSRSRTKFKTEEIIKFRVLLKNVNWIFEYITNGSFSCHYKITARELLLIWLKWHAQNNTLCIHWIMNECIWMQEFSFKKWTTLYTD